MPIMQSVSDDILIGLIFFSAISSVAKTDLFHFIQVGQCKNIQFKVNLIMVSQRMYTLRPRLDIIIIHTSISCSRIIL